MRVLGVCVFITFLASVYCFSYLDVLNDEWEAFKVQFRKKYDSHVEESFRRKIYAENKHKIAKHNRAFYNGEVSFNVKMNEYGDMLHHEFVTTMNGFLYNHTLASTYRKNALKFVAPDDDVKLPKEVDWREKGAVTPIKNQGRCGSCWAFSTTGSLEGQHFRQTGNLVSLSEQNLVDCSKDNSGCNGGMMDYAFSFVKEEGGIDTEESYPYLGIDGQDCKFSIQNVGAEDQGYMDIRKDEHTLKKAVATIGPVSVAIDASHQSFQLYSDGVYYEPDCSSEQLDHGVLVVGYGTSEEGDDYWIVKNSWGTTWGLDGFIHMARNRDDNCGIASMASYPTV